MPFQFSKSTPISRRYKVRPQVVPLTRTRFRRSRLQFCAHVYTFGVHSPTFDFHSQYSAHTSFRSTFTNPFFCLHVHNSGHTHIAEIMRTTLKLLTQRRSHSVGHSTRDDTDALLSLSIVCHIAYHVNARTNESVVNEASLPEQLFKYTLSVKILNCCEHYIKFTLCLHHSRSL
jgi:hypothetical protein